MASLIETHRSGAEVVSGDAICRKKSVDLLEELGLPKGLLPMEDIQDFGYNRTTGFMWLVQRKKKLSVVEVYVPEASPEKVTFKTGTGLSDSFDATAFALGE
uniref:Uncharacterized protein n=1 Tax=Setaria italica TaxID=4555 RepID=K3Z303_SETIT